MANIKKLCYVIMPYGGNDKNKKIFYENVYNHLIVPPCSRLLYQVKRQNLNPEYRTAINASIFNDLLRADLVIADLSELRWNVAFEIGYRIALQQNREGTAAHCMIFLFNRLKGITYSQLRQFEYILDPQMKDGPVFYNTTTIQKFRELIYHFCEPNHVPFMINQQTVIDYTDEDVPSDRKEYHDKFNRIQMMLLSAIRQMQFSEEESERIQDEKNTNYKDFHREELELEENDVTDIYAKQATVDKDAITDMTPIDDLGISKSLSS